MPAKETSIVLALVSAVMFTAMIAWSPGARAQNDQELANKLANPVSDLMSFPFQLNYDDNIGPQENGSKYTLNIQPVIPKPISPSWNIISRTILPIINQKDVAPGSGTESGFGDTTQSFFFSPKAPTAGGWIWGVGPAIVLPTASQDSLGSGKWSIGPTAVALKQTRVQSGGAWTYGALVNQVWSVAGESDRQYVSNAFLQPFLAYTTPKAWTYTVNSESNYNWRTNDWSTPINLQISKIVRFGKLPVQIGGGVRYWVSTPENVGPKDWGLRFFITPMVPANR
jgi:hypothetical protein